MATKPSRSSISARKAAARAALPLVVATAAILLGATAGPAVAPPGAAASGPAAKPGPALVPADAARVLEEVRRPGASVVLLNVWATWCQPCREEFPDLMKLRRAWADHGLKLVLVSADFDDARDEAVRFLAAHGVDFPTYLKDGPDMEFIDGLDRRWSGALPATFLYDASGRLRKFWEGKTDYATLERRVQEILSGRAAAPSSEEKP